MAFRVTCRMARHLHTYLLRTLVIAVLTCCEVSRMETAQTSAQGPLPSALLLQVACWWCNLICTWHSYARGAISYAHGIIHICQWSHCTPGRQRPLRACLRRFRAGDFAAGADSDDESAQQVCMEMARHENCNPKTLTLNPNSMMQANSSATLNEPMVASTQFRRFRQPDPKNSVAFACCAQM